MKAINLFNELLNELYKIFKDLGINYMYEVYTSENGTVLCCDTGEKHIVFSHKEMNDLYHSVYNKIISFDHSCLSDTSKVIDSRNYYLTYNGIGNFKVINGYNLKDYITDEKNIINVALLYDHSMLDLFFELLIALHYYRTHDGKNLSSILISNFTTEDFFEELKKMSLQQYTYPGFMKGEFIDTLWHRKEEADFHRNFSLDLLNVIDQYASDSCNNLLNTRSAIRANLKSGYLPVRNPALMAINIKRMNGDKLDKRLKSIKLGCIYGEIPDSYSDIVDNPYLKFANNPKEFIIINYEVFVEVTELIKSIMSRNRESLINSIPFSYDEELKYIMKYGLHDNMTPSLRKKFYKSVLQKVLGWIEEIRLSPYRVDYIDKIAKSIDHKTNLYLQKILNNIQKNVSRQIRRYIREMLKSLRDNISTVDKNFSLNDFSSNCSSHLDGDEYFLRIFRLFSNNNSYQKEKNILSSSYKNLDLALNKSFEYPTLKMLFPDIRINNNVSNTNITYDFSRTSNDYAPPSKVLSIVLILPVIIIMFCTFLRKAFKITERERNGRAIVRDPEVIGLDYCPRR